MKFRINRKFDFFALLTLFFFNLMMRYPDFPYQEGTDSFGNHVISQNIINEGSEPRFIHWLSFFGLYPFSNSMGCAFLLSTFSVVPNVELHASIFFLGLIFSIIGSLASYLAALELTGDTRIAVFSAFVFTTCRYFLSFTSWTYSYRALLMVFIPFLYLLVFRIIKSKRTFGKDTLLLFLFLVISLSLHHASLLFFVAILAYFLHLILASLFRARNFNLRIYSSNLKFGFCCLLLISLYSYFAYYSFFIGASDSTRLIGSKLFVSGFKYYELVNLALMYAMVFGLSFPFALIGLVNITDKVTFSMGDLNGYLILLLASYSIIWTDTFYSVLIIMPIIPIIIAKASDTILNRENRKLGIFGFPLIFILLMIGQYIPEIVTVADSSKLGNVDETYDRQMEIEMAENTGFYLSSEGMDYDIHSEKISATRIASYSGYYLHSFSPPLNYEVYNYKLSNLSAFFSGQTDSLIGKYSESETISMKYGVIFSGKEYDDESVRLAILSNYHSNKLILALYPPSPLILVGDDGNEVASVFLYGVVENSYKFYSADYHELYFLNLGD